ncbi:MAG: hypothetical protein Q4D79_12300 [Propionibacteriaceae bacterium]|nr:hypothetical protein [Propionibacteriaceae bacterium]
MAKPNVTTWEEFNDRLFRVLLTIEDRVYLIISARGDLWRYVQFAADADSLTGESVGNSILKDAYKLDEAAQARMRELGWKDPEGPSQPNWSRLLELPATSNEVRAVSDASIYALRDALKIPSPADLEYKAWRERERPVPGAVYEEEELEELDPGENPLELDLGIEMNP